MSEARPCEYQFFTRTSLLKQQRGIIAQYLKAPVGNCVFVQNATTGVNTVLRNIVFKPGDVIIYFATIYGSCEKTISYITETTPAESRKISYTYPVSDDFLCSAFESAVDDVRAQGKNPRICTFDTITSMPGVRMPFERLTALCRQHGVLSLIDGAHSVGQIPLDLGTLDPDFFVSNCHKWLFTPRGSAIFYVAERSQALMRSTLPTSHGFVPLPTPGAPPIANPMTKTDENAFETQFAFVGTMDMNTYFCVGAALEWRGKLRWRDHAGEDAVHNYLQHLARRAGDIVSTALGPGAAILENEERTLGRCAFATVRLPLDYQQLTGGDSALGYQCWDWIRNTLIHEYKTFIPPVFYNGSFWVRLSAQVYLDEDDFVWGANVLKEICKRAQKGEWKKEAAVAKI
ncbi:PLP-dependent transferase [Polychaeton citri CBS 116435]|uniref:PLP-dependent transferase n=1 Tax=Polychaeton citri CBS 116435 TaxID=1314669 RepID=A0A9P4URR6_9PEZI|nr:PLP-dependent transferase [Polychaeton citri CBS 116435]